MGAEALSDQRKPPDKTWDIFTVETLNESAALGRPVFFDLTHVQDIGDILQGVGRYADTITAVELRHIYRNWSLFQKIVQFYESGAEREAP